MKIQSISYVPKSVYIQPNNKDKQYFYSTKSDFFEKQNTYPAISFEGITAKGVVKQRGLLMHITSLPAYRSFCGQFGDPQTYKFIEWLKASKQTHWIMNPLNALEEHLCPYSSAGRFSRNKFIVNLNKLTENEYGRILKKRELPDDIPVPEFTLEMLERQKNPRFKIAFARFKKLDENTPIKQEYNEFLKINDDLWLNDYANYDFLARRYGNDWTKWPKALQSAPEESQKSGISLNERIKQILKNSGENVSEEEFSDGVNLYKFEQFLYDKQFNETVEYLNRQNIHLIMDLPIGVSPTGVDTWGKKGMFLLDENFRPTKVSGCPPESNYPYTQVWDHALYNYDSPEFWEYQEKSLRQLVKSSDLRLDHFVGYINRAAIPTSYVKEDGTVLLGYDIFKPTTEGGMGCDFFLPEWIETIVNKRNQYGENVFDLFVRIAKEAGKNPEDTYILENFGPLSKTKAYKKFDKQYGERFISQKVPIGSDIKDATKKDRANSPFGEIPYNTALLTGNHDLPSLRQMIDALTDKVSPNSTSVTKKAQKLFDRFCTEVLKLTEEEKANKDIIFENTMKWFYTKDVKQVQTTLQDALGLWWRPNIPGFWHGSEEKYLQKPTPEGLLPFWNKVFPRDFLTRENKSGINPGYKSLADKFTDMMQNLFS